MSTPNDARDALGPFFDDGLLADVLYELKSGKEATVHCCRGGDALGGALVAAKIHHDAETRRFKNDAIYHAGRVHLAREGRVSRAVTGRTAFGRRVQYTMWVEHEWETMQLLAGAGLPCPDPIARGGRAILMTFIGDEDGPAPRLQDVELDRAAAAEIADDLLAAIESMLDLQRVHGDLSPYNVLYHERRAVLIDFPQSIDPRLNPAGQTLLVRDVENVCAWAARHGVRRPAGRISADLWTRFVLGALG